MKMLLKRKKKSNICCDTPYKAQLQQNCMKTVCLKYTSTLTECRKRKAVWKQTHGIYTQYMVKEKT